MAVEIMIARHGQNEDNVNGILNGHRDLPLTNLGRQQARDLGQGIIDAGLTFDAVYCSPLARAHETADIAAEVANLPEPEVMQNLIERDYGIMTGKPIDDIEKIVGSENILKTDVVTYFLDPEGAETFPELIERGQKILNEVRVKHQKGRVLLVCHGDIGKMIYAAATGTEWHKVLKDFHFGNGDLIDVSGNGDVHKVKLEQFNH
jgi:probable phosphoglycerate mutase